VRNANLLTQHALSLMRLRRFPQAQLKLDQILNITPDDGRTIALKASIAQAEGDLPQAAALLAPLHPNADDPGTLETQVYQAILERQPASIIPGLQEILNKPEPELRYFNGDLRVWLAWAQHIAGDDAAAQKSWQQARSELESLLKDEPENYNVIGDLALTNMGLGDKRAAIALAERAIAANPLDKDAVSGPSGIEVLARVSAQMGEPDRAVAALQKLLSVPALTDTAAPFTPALLRLDPMFDPLRNDSRFQELVTPAGIPKDLATPAQVPEKSIAVLPFENRSSDPENAFFTDGVQDEILTDLARIADLKVISRTSVRQYKTGAKRNLRQIGNELGVAHVVEGSVQRAGNRIRVNAQLIDARTDAHLWAQTYDRDLADVFTIQSEIAKTIADQLQAKLSPNEKTAIDQTPTGDVTAFDLYTRAKILSEVVLLSDTEENLRQAIELLNQAVARDPSFFNAYCQLGYAHDAIYFSGSDHTPARLALAEAAIQTAFRLRPAAGESHLARAWNLYWGYLDYDGALAELKIARQSLPNDPKIFLLTALVTRRQGRWDESIQNFERAMDRDPRNVVVLQQAWLGYGLLRRYREEEALLDRALAVVPGDLVSKVQRGVVELNWHADTHPLHDLIDETKARNPAALSKLADAWLVCALGERDSVAVKDALKVHGENRPQIGTNNISLTRLFLEGVIARMSKDEDKARSAFTAARAEQEKTVQAQPNHGPALCVLALIDAGLGRKEDALREGRRAMELLPPEKDSVNGPAMIGYFAMIAAWVGDKDLAFEQLAAAIRYPSSLSYGQLKLFPFWDPLRGDPRFEALVEEVKLPVALSASESGARSAAKFAPAPKKSIAVLPFENRSSDPENAFFTDGVQDEILTDLARIAALKVISRTSVMQYKTGAKRNLRQIGNELGVAHVVEGSVQRAGNRVRVNAQLIDAGNDAHLWAQTYDRDLADVFAIQSEIAQTIADQLQAKLSPSEKSAIEQPPTTDITAFDLYSHAKNLFLTAFAGSNGRADLLQAADLLKQAVARDPLFFQAYCQLAFTEINIYGVLDHNPANLAEAETALQSAARLRPDAGETHLARARNLYWGYRDYDGALRELEIARQSLPGEDWIFSLKGYIERRQGRWEDCIRDLEHATELDPRNVLTLQQMAQTYQQLRRYAEEKSTYERILAFEPNDPVMKSLHAFVEFDSKADTRALQKVIDSIRNKNPAALPSIADNWLLCAFAERDADAARNALNALGENRTSLGPIVDVRFNRQFMEGIIATIAKDDVRARKAFTAARAEHEKIIRAQPNYGPALCVRALVDAALGWKEQALQDGRRAVELCPIEKDAVLGIAMVKYLAMIAAWVGDKDRACEQLAIAVSRPGDLSYGQLKLMPFWDPLRGDPRFEQIVASLAPNGLKQ
jgi:serine/threonine-protein kinase